MAVPTAHRIWKVGTITLLLTISIHLTLNGFFRERTTLTDSSELKEKHYEPGRKIIYLLFDALREDFCEWPDDVKTNLETEPFQAYQGQKLTLFRDLAEKQPNNSIFLPLQSEMPTVTVVRMKGFLSGILSTVLEMTSILGGAFTEDNVL